jgi:hypothetical protein
LQMYHFFQETIAKLMLLAEVLTPTAVEYYVSYCLAD